MKPVLQSLKKVSYLLYGAPLLAFLLPFVGQGWSLTVWKNVYLFTFAPLCYFLQLRLGIIRSGKYVSNVAHFVVFIGFLFATGLTGRFAYSNRSHPIIACLDSLTLIALFAILIRYGPRLRKAFFLLQDLETNKVPFDLTAETFRLPKQSNEAAEYPRPNHP